MTRKLMYLSAMIMIFGMLVQDSGYASSKKTTKKKGYLGVSVKDVSSRKLKKLNLEHGVVIEWIEEDSPADKDGLMEDDIILAVNGTLIRKSQTLTRVIRKIEPGTKAKIDIMRDNKKQTIQVEIGERQKSESFFLKSPQGAFSLLGSNIFLGISVQELNEDLAEYFGVKPDEGVLVLEVKDDSPALDAGIKAGDVILKIDDEEVGDPGELKEILSDYDEGDEITIEVYRHNKKKEIKVVLEEDEKKWGKKFYMHNFPGLEHLEIDIEKMLDRNLDCKKDLNKKIKIKRYGSNSI